MNFYMQDENQPTGTPTQETPETPATEEQAQTPTPEEKTPETPAE